MKQKRQDKKTAPARKIAPRKHEPADAIQVVRPLLAGYILLLLLLQLFTFEKFPSLVADASFLRGAWTHGSAIMLVVAELLALPFLLQIRFPRWVMRTSFVAGVVALVMLAGLEIMAFIHGQTVLFGATFDLPGGSWSLLFIAALWVLMAWNIWMLVQQRGQAFSSVTRGHRNRSSP